MSDDDGSGSGSESDEPIKWFPPEEFHIPHETQEEEEWSEDHVKLAYMIFLYAKCAQTPEEKESWIRDSRELHATRRHQIRFLPPVQ